MRTLLSSAALALSLLAPAIVHAQTAPPVRPEPTTGSSTTKALAATGAPTYDTPEGCVEVNATTACSLTGGGTLVSVEQISSGGVSLSQIGDRNTAVINQSTGSGQRVMAMQDGTENSLTLTQAGTSNWASLTQTGDLHTMNVVQSGTGPAVLLATQQGVGNQLSVGQYVAGSQGLGASVSQSGVANSLSVAQSGANNQLVLSQQGDGNAMSASQAGEGRRLVWTQVGSNLPDLRISQTGGGYASQMIVSQTGGR